MPKTKNILAVFLICIYSSSLTFAQNIGSYFSNFQLTGRAEIETPRQMAVEDNGNIIFGNTSNITIYDGVNTTLINTEENLTKVKFIPELGKTFVCCDGIIGYTNQNINGDDDFLKVSTPGLQNQLFDDICNDGKDIYIASDEYIIKVSDYKMVQKWRRPPEGTFNGIFSYMGIIYANVSTAGLFSIRSDKLVKCAINSNTINPNRILFSIKRNSNEIILGADNSKLYLFNGKELKLFISECAKYISDNVLMDGKYADNNHLVLSTFKGGILVVNSITGKIEELFNTSTGFPDDNISCMAIDRYKGIWVNHQLGTTRIDLNIPVKQFYSLGLRNRVYSITEYDNKLFAGCSDGLYYLSTGKSDMIHAKLKPNYIDNKNLKKFSKIIGINGKVKKMITTPDGIIIGTNKGLYTYSNLKVRLVYNGNVRDFTYYDGCLALSNYLGEVFYINLNQNNELIKLSVQFGSDSTDYSTTLFLENTGILWIGRTGKVLRLRMDKTARITESILIKVPSKIPELYHVCKIKKYIYFVSYEGIYCVDPKSLKPDLIASIQVNKNETFQYILSKESHLLFIKTEDGWKEIINKSDLHNRGLLDLINNPSYLYKNSSGTIWIVSKTGLIYFTNNRYENITIPEFKVHIRKFSLINYKYSSTGQIEVSYGTNAIFAPNSTYYQFSIDGLDSDWSDWSLSTSRNFTLVSGKYKLNVRARDIYGNLSSTGFVNFTIEPPFWNTWWFFTLCLIIFIGFVWTIFKWRTKSKYQKNLESQVIERTAELNSEKLESDTQRKRSDELLLNILPYEVAEELKLKGSADAKQYDEVTVLFTDFKDFTQISEKMSPAELVDELNTFFRAFDEIVTRLNIEKIKTIGDSYMCVGGLPIASTSHAEDVVNVGIAIQEFVQQHSQLRVSQGKEPLLIRIGIHTGPVIAGIVGIKKYAYDIWGDTVNTASRMESSGEAGKVNISETTYKLVKDKFRCTPRGKVMAKHKGEMEMYFVEGRI